MALSGVDEARAALARVRAGFEAGRTLPIAWRSAQLAGIRRFVVERQLELTSAVTADLGRPAAETFLAELLSTAREAQALRRHLRRWTRSRRAPVPLVLHPARARLERRPLGVVGVIGTWNYPVNLVLVPSASALAAGNAVVIKCSELAPATAEVLAEHLGDYVDSDAVAVVRGGPEATETLIDGGLDHVFFTGSGNVARLVMARAAASLTPVTLELGGKSPVLVDASADLEIAARRIAWGKFLNAGQSCAAPDFALVDRRVLDRFAALLEVAITELYGEDPAASADLARIVNDKHLGRLSGLLESGGGTVLVGGQIDRTTRYVAPTLLLEPDPSSALMSEEIFGPILPLVGVTDLDGAAVALNNGPTPLAVYVFASPRRARALGETVRAGAVVINTTLHHFSAETLPFGGVGASGTGQYHGRYGLERLSQLRPVFEKATWADLRSTYPPYARPRARRLRRALGEQGKRRAADQVGPGR